MTISEIISQLRAQRDLPMHGCGVQAVARENMGGNIQVDCYLLTNNYRITIDEECAVLWPTCLTDKEFWEAFDAAEGELAVINFD